MVNHFPDDADYELPPFAVASSLVRGLTALDSVMGAKQLEPNGECAVDLKILDAGQLALVLTLKAFSYLTAEYKFPLKAIEVDQKAMLEAKMRDMEESLKGGLRSPVFISLKATAVTAPNQKVAWNVEYKSEPAYFDLSSDTTTVNIMKPGLYQVQLTGTKQGINSGNGVRLLVGGKTESSAAPHQMDSQFRVEISRVVKVAEKIALTVECYGGHNLNADCVLEVFLLQEFAP
ncbi:unnamed protein product [Aphanomyces euteiches]